MLSVIRNNPAIHLTLKMWEFSEGNRPKVVLYLIMSAASNFIDLIEPLILATFINEIQRNSVTQNNIAYLLGLLPLFLLVKLVVWSFHGPARIMEQKNAFMVRANYRKYLFGGLLSLPMSWHNEHHSGDTVDKINKGTGSIYDFTEETFEIIRMPARLLGAYIALVYFNIHAAYVVIVMVLIASTIVIKFDKILMGQYVHLNRCENRIAEKITDVINNIETAVILRIENQILKSIWEKTMAPFKLFTDSAKLNELKWFLVSVCAAICKILVIGSFILVTFLNGRTLLIGTLVALHGYVKEINDLFFYFASIYSNIVKYRTRVANSEEVSNDFNQCRKITNGKMPVDWQELRVENLSFNYDKPDNSSDPQLKDISFSARRGERIALIGLSGSGKTTALKVMRELYQPDSAEIFLDGRLLSKGFGSISSDITLVPQNPQIFNSTIAENITSWINHDMQHILKFSDMAKFTEVAEKLPHGFNSWIKERGVNLSTGQNQRLALARGLMACDDKQILLLDEPTSSVDFINESAIHFNIFNSFQDKTIISSVHKLHLLPRFDRIYFLDGGRIIANGTFQDLLENCPRFLQMWTEYNTTELPRLMIDEQPS